MSSLETNSLEPAACAPAFWDYFTQSDTKAQIGHNSVSLFNALSHLAFAAADCRACDHRVDHEQRNQHFADLNSQFRSILTREKQIDTALRTLSVLSTSSETKSIPTYLIEGSLLRRSIASDTLRSLGLLLSRPKPDIDIPQLDSKSVTVLLSDYCCSRVVGLKEHKSIILAFKALAHTYAEWEESKYEGLNTLLPTEQIDSSSGLSTPIRCPCGDCGDEIAIEHLSEAETYLQVAALSDFLRPLIESNQTLLFTKPENGTLPPLLQSILDSALHKRGIAMDLRRTLLEFLGREDRVQRVLDRHQHKSYVEALMRQQSALRAELALNCVYTAEACNRESEETWPEFSKYWTVLFPLLRSRSDLLPIGSAGISLDTKLFIYSGKKHSRITDQDMRLFLQTWQSKIEVYHDLEVPRLCRQRYSQEETQ